MTEGQIKCDSFLISIIFEDIQGIPDIIESASQLGVALKYLSIENCNAVLDIPIWGKKILGSLKSIINSGTALGFVLKNLDAEHQGLVIGKMKEILKTIIKSWPELQAALRPIKKMWIVLNF